MYYDIFDLYPSGNELVYKQSVSTMNHVNALVKQDIGTFIVVNKTSYVEIQTTYKDNRSDVTILTFGPIQELKDRHFKQRV